MGEVFGLPEWLSLAAFGAIGLAIWTAAGNWFLHRAHARVAARRDNPAQAEFLAMMSDDCSPEGAQFMWDQTLPYVRPILTPHPDDHLIDDLRIDDDDLDFDWPRDWAERFGLRESDIPDWPEGWELTIRNFGRWLDLGPQ